MTMPPSTNLESSTTLERAGPGAGPPLAPSRVSAKERAGELARPTNGTLIGLLLLMFLSALDQTIVAIALPTIAGDLHGMRLYEWVFGAYAITSTCLTPFYGTLSDKVGRARILKFGAAMFLVASA